MRENRTIPHEHDMGEWREIRDEHGIVERYRECAVPGCFATESHIVGRTGSVFIGDSLRRELEESERAWLYRSFVISVDVSL